MSTEATRQKQVHSFAGIEQVVADTPRFKRKLAIGEDAYTSMRMGKALSQLWDVSGVAATGGTIAASTTVAGTFFATGGWLSAVGLGAAAATPIGWVVGAALATGGAYYGVTRLFKSYYGSRVDVIPKFINTPVDLLGASLMDMIGGLIYKLAQMDGEISEPERAAIKTYFIDEWGFDPQYTKLALSVIEENINETTLKHMVESFGDFARSNPDCNFDAMRIELLAFLREIAVADGRLDEREEFAIEKVEALLGNIGSLESIGLAVASAPSEVMGFAQRIMGSVKRKLDSKNGA
jgi:uncharacterized tellurite resistance protein B-like protein